MYLNMEVSHQVFSV